MGERYRLVFRGEVLAGQHKAVVKQRLGATLKLEGARLDALFTGKAVTIRKDADKDTAVRFEVAFKRAGARLRVVPIDAVVARPAPPRRAPPPDVYQLAPVGALLVEPRPAPPPPAPAISHLSVAAPGTRLAEPRVNTAAVLDLSHLTIAALGADLQIPRASSVVAFAAIAIPTWEVARPGVDLVPRAPAAEPPFDLDHIEFELAPLGARLVMVDRASPPAPPDTSHLRVEAI